MPMPRVSLVDFNLDGDRIPWVPAVPATVGEFVLMKDGDGNACFGTVVDITANGVAWIEPDWATWLPANTPVNISPAGAVGSRFVVHNGDYGQNSNPFGNARTLVHMSYPS